MYIVSLLNIDRMLANSSLRLTTVVITELSLEGVLLLLGC